MENVELTLAEDSLLGRAGERVTLALSPADVGEPSEMPTMLFGYKPFQFRADEASPVVMVERDEDKFRSFNTDSAFKRVHTKGSMQGAIPEVDPGTSLASYHVVERYMGSYVPDQVRQNVVNPNWDPLEAGARRAMNAILLDHEIDVFELLGTSANWDTSVRTAIAGGSEWDDATPGNPITDLQTAIMKSWQPVTEIWMNQKVAFAFLANQHVRDYMRVMLGDQAVSQDLAGVANATQRNVDFRIPGFPVFKIVASKYKNDSTGLLDYTLSSDVVVLTTTPLQSVPKDGEEIASSYTFRRRGPNGVGINTRTFRVEGRGPQGGTMVVVYVADIPKMVGNNAGGIITNVTV